MAELVAAHSLGTLDAESRAAAEYPVGAWEDIGERVAARTAEHEEALPPGFGYVRLGHGTFCLPKHPRLTSIAPPRTTTGAAETAAFWGSLNAWGYGDGSGGKGVGNGRKNAKGGK